MKKRLAAKSPRSPRKQRSEKAPKAILQTQIRSGTKQSTAIEMLRPPDGANIEALMKATGWQQHSVRGFLAGVVRKRLKLGLDSSVVEGVRIYRIADGSSEAPVQRRNG